LKQRYNTQKEGYMVSHSWEKELATRSGIKREGFFGRKSCISDTWKTLLGLIKRRRDFMY